MEHVQAEVEKASRYWFAIDSEVLLLQVPTTGTSDEGWEDAVGAELVLFFAYLKVNLLANGVVEVQLSVDHVVPGWCA